MQTTKSKDGTVLAYDIIGSGPVLVYITGASCFRNFDPIQKDVKEFSKEFTVYNYDRRGRGDSGDTLPYSIEREVEDVEAIIDAAGGEAYLYGHSSGAALALESAMRLGSKVKKVVLYDAPYVGNEAEKDEYDRLNANINKLLTEGKNAKAMKNFLKGIGMPKLFVFLMPFMPDWKTMVKLAPTLSYDMELTKDLPPLERAAKINIPVQIIVGSKSPKELQSVGEQLANVIPHSNFLKLEGEDHMVKAKNLLPVLTQFLK